MGRIVVSEFVTVDGVIEDPGGSEGSSRGGWAFRFKRGAEGDKFSSTKCSMLERCSSVGRRMRASLAAQN